MTTHVTYDTSTILIFAVDEVIKFIGTGDTLNFAYSSQNDKVTATGTDQTIQTGRSGEITIVDQSHGLTLDFGAPSPGMVVQDFQNDATGKIAAFQYPVTFASDHHGGTMATSLGVSVDFKGFHDIAALEARFV